MKRPVLLLPLLLVLQVLAACNDTPMSSSSDTEPPVERE